MVSEMCHSLLLREVGLKKIEIIGKANFENAPTSRALA